MLKVVLTVVLAVVTTLAPSCSWADSADQGRGFQVKNVIIRMLDKFTDQELLMLKDVMKNFLNADLVDTAKQDPAALSAAKPEPEMAAVTATVEPMAATRRSADLTRVDATSPY